MRCTFVDLYYTLYGKKKPICLPSHEIRGLLAHIPNASDVSSSFLSFLLNHYFFNNYFLKLFLIQLKSESSSSLKRKAASPLMKEAELVTDDLGVVTVEVVARDEQKRIKVGTSHLFLVSLVKLFQSLYCLNPEK
jgi:hypothetical protein